MEFRADNRHTHAQLHTQMETNSSPRPRGRLRSGLPGVGCVFAVRLAETRA